MVLFSFSIPDHVPLIKLGTKHQTTRIPRKPHKNGSPAYKVGDNIQLYYRLRQKKSCNNCIKIKDCIFYNTHEYAAKLFDCPEHTNFFGESKITEIRHYDIGEPCGNETWFDHWIGNMLPIEKELWAKADGFNSWAEANFWFKKSTKFDLWAYQPLDVIIWDPEPIIKKWSLEDK